MSARSVRAVFFWRYPKSAFRAVYGRFPGTLYSKDFFQCPSDQWKLMDSVLGRAPDGRVPIEYRWPGGTRKGEFRKSAADNRGQLAWVTADGAPAPWKVGNPATAGVVIPGDPSKTTEDGAEQELATLEGLDLDPWVVAVKLEGGDGILHARAYLGKAPAGQENHSTQVLPAIVREAMAKVAPGSGGGVLVPQMRAMRLLERVVSALSQDPNVLLVGPPGTGKTVVLEDLRELFGRGGVAPTFDPEKWDGEWGQFTLPDAKERKTISLAFHPSYGYEEFVAGLIPKTQGAGVGLTARPGPLLSLSHWAGDPGRSALLCLDEFNRGPTAAIFGDTLALLDKDKRSDPEVEGSGATVERPYPLEEMKVAKKYANSTGLEVALEVRIPNSVWVVAALNSSDRSVAPLDAALRRRFSILHVPPDYEALATRIGTPLPNWGGTFSPTAPEHKDWSPGDVKEMAVRLLRVLNDRIGLVLGQDFLLGHALLWSVRGATTEELARSLSHAFDERVAATLRLTFLDQDEALGAILNAGPPPSSEQPTSGGDDLVHWIVPSASLQGVATPRLQVREAQGITWPNALKALHSLL